MPRLAAAVRLLREHFNNNIACAMRELFTRSLKDFFRVSMNANVVLLLRQPVGNKHEILFYIRVFMLRKKQITRNWPTGVGMKMHR